SIQLLPLTDHCSLPLSSSNLQYLPLYAYLLTLHLNWPLRFVELPTRKFSPLRFATKAKPPPLAKGRSLNCAQIKLLAFICQLQLRTATFQCLPYALTAQRTFLELQYAAQSLPTLSLLFP